MSLFILLALLAIAPRQASLQTYQFVKQSSSALAITDDGSRLLVVNPDSNSVSVMDPLAGEKLAELTVGDDPRTVPWRAAPGPTLPTAAPTPCR
jgi:YVTN family beta-propeller protein